MNATSLDAPPSDLLRRCAEAVDRAVPHSVVASTTAARLHGLWLPAVPDDLHLACATPGRLGRQMTRSRRGELVAHRFQLAPSDVTSIHGIPTTGLARTWRDLARVLGLPDLVAAGDSALRLGASLEEMSAPVADAYGAGAARARRALRMLDARSRSRPESHLRVAVADVATVPFLVNEPVYRVEGGWLAEPDLALVTPRIAVEYQGVDHADEQRMRRDLTRFADMRRCGWLVLPYGPAEILGRPWEVRAEVRAALVERAPQLVRAHSRRRAAARGVAVRP